ncbi:hypothetical protein M231_00440 [Tremella mesenterica]|uniref:RGS domain-containing protein n=1 Tax=Tremella mesenterica TaxID=5217 RepID=A0A4Q1BVA1_TREME|nr:hypothetical protein M231_00440 [Tremella mesenterica]
MDEKAGVEPRRQAPRYLQLNRLPTLQEVLDRRTRAPLDLFCFWIWLESIQCQDGLDFWLDVQQHENLCKAYFKDLRRSGRSIHQDWPEYANYARENGSHFSPLLALREEPNNPNSGITQSPRAARRSSDLDPPRLVSPVSPTFVPPVSSPTMPSRPSDLRSSDPMSFKTHDSTNEHGWASRNSKAPVVIPRDRAIEKAALVDGAERIYLRYLLPGAEREIYLPPSLRMDNFPMTNGSDPSPLIPDLFHAQKQYIYKLMEADYFPRFLRAKSFCNLTKAGGIIRLIAGFAVLWGAFVLAFSFIFLDYPRHTRLWIILPLFVAWNLLVPAYYDHSPLLFLFSRAETSPFRTIRVRERFVWKIHGIRALWVEALALALTAGLSVLFVLVPGHRL